MFRSSLVAIFREVFSEAWYMEHLPQDGHNWWPKHVASYAVDNTILTHSLTQLFTYLLACLLTYLLIPCSRAPLEKLTGFQLVKKFPAFCGTRSFITPFTSAHHLFLSWASSIQSTPPTSHFLKIHHNIIFPFKLLSSMWSLQISPPKPSVHHSSPQYALHAPPILFSILSPEQYWVSSTDH
jgi:hypothetical protein